MQHRLKSRKWFETNVPRRILKETVNAWYKYIRGHLSWTLLYGIENKTKLKMAPIAE